MKKNIKKGFKKGFSLIEALIVLIFVSIVFSISVHVFNHELNILENNKKAQQLIEKERIKAFKYFDKNKTFKGFDSECDVVIATDKFICIEKFINKDVSYRFNLHKDYKVIKGFC